MATCRNCRRTIKGAGFRSPTGATVCRNCHDTVAGAALGIMSGGGLPTAVAMAGNDPKKGGILNWVRTALRKKK